MTGVDRCASFNKKIFLINLLAYRFEQSVTKAALAQSPAETREGGFVGGGSTSSGKPQTFGMAAGRPARGDNGAPPSFVAFVGSGPGNVLRGAIILSECGQMNGWSAGVERR
jgi:hypothetical protein